MVLEKHNINEKLISIGWTPLHTRFFAHRIGDGSVNHYGHYEWNNKYMDEFVQLAKFLNIKVWGPIKSDKWGTQKIVIHKNNFKNFAEFSGNNCEEVIKKSALLLDIIKKLPYDHQLQAILAVVVDDGSFRHWMPTIFEDKNEEVFNRVKDLWDSLFPSTSRVYEFNTKKGTHMYRLQINRNGVLALWDETQRIVEKYGDLAGLWWKQKDFERRYEKAVSKRAKELNETKTNKVHRNNVVFDYLKQNKFITISKAQRILNLTLDRTRRVLLKLVNNGSIFLVKAGSKSRYSLENEDTSFNFRSEKVREYIKQHDRVTNKNCRDLFNVKDAQAYNLLKKMKNQKIIAQIKEKGTTYYKLF